MFGEKVKVMSLKGFEGEIERRYKKVLLGGRGIG
jgi:hypothetical protein